MMALREGYEAGSYAAIAHSETHEDELVGYTVYCAAALFE
jgi:hypothetical protein